jgi:hypothetical protein
MRPTRRRDLEMRTLEGEIVILDLVNGTVHRLNETASRIWNDCDGTRTVSDIVIRLAATFHLAPSDLLEDVVATIADLQRLGLLTEGSTDHSKSS